MLYRELGQTGLKVSQLGFGAMRLPMVKDGEEKKVNDELAVPMIHKAIEAGVNYIDTAVMYCHHDSQRAVGKALKGWRDKVVVSTKNHYFGDDESKWWQNLEDSLRLLDIDCIDIYNCHGMNWDTKWCQWVDPYISKWLQKAKDQGLIKHICCSFHDNAENLVKIIDTDFFESITLQYNILDRKLEDGIAYAKEKNLGVVVMGPVGGGRLGAGSEVLEGLLPHIERVPELAMRFVLSNPNVDVALSGMSTMEHVEENIQVCSDKISLKEEEKQAIEEHLARMHEMEKLYCTGCEYCLPCPQEVAIPKIFERYNVGRVYGLWEHAKKAYSRIGTNKWDTGNKADACVDCGICEDKCPQDIPIRKQLKEAHAMLAEEDTAKAAE
ncbi:MAG: aldo/keto reductase [Phycisphaerae bacterium]